MGRPQLEGDLVLLAQVERLDVLAAAQVPEVEAMAVLAVEQQLGLHAGLDHLRGAPLAADHRVVAEVPPEVVVQVLVAAVDLPAAEHVEGVVVEHEDAAGTLAVGGAEGADVDAVGSAVDGVPLGVAGLAATSSGSIVLTICGWVGSGLVSMM